MRQRVTTPDDEFISEPLRPLRGTFGTQAMSTGLPGLPAGFTWRDTAYTVVAVVAAWKASAPSSGQLYLRRHYYRLQMSDGSEWTVYFLRHVYGNAARKRWYLESRVV